MATINPRVQRLHQAIRLEERRAVLQEQLDDVLRQLEAIKQDVFGSAAGAAPVTDVKSSFIQSAMPRVESSSAAPVARAPRAKGRAARGELKARILQLLNGAGSSGLRVKELADALGVKAANIYAWFQAAARRYPYIRKVGEAHYCIVGQVPEGDLQLPTPKDSPARRPLGRPPGRRSVGTGMRRGQLSEQILALLQKAGPSGLRVKEIANTLRVKDKNIFVWFATTGKKNPDIRKVAEATYCLLA